MSRFSVHRALPPHRRRFAFALLAIPAILAGLLAMHVLNTGMMGAAASTAAHSSHEEQTVSTATHSSLAASSSDAARLAGMPMTPADSGQGHDCGGPCIPGHEMLGMMCVLALLVGVILFTRQQGLGRWLHHLLAVPALGAEPATQAPPRPPSLHALSISRT